MDKYMKIRKIGEGAFGKAILVKEKKNGKQCVIKEINIIRMSPKEREEARKEVAVLAQLNHPNIVTYRESFEEHGSLFIAMDFCERGDLYARINSQRGILIQEEQILDWFVQICLAIKHIHDRKILHRDIKSQNIFLASDGSIKLGDFGIAKVLNSTAELARTCIGTPYYLSPEICENRPYNNKSDIWALGCVLYEMTTLKHAFEAGNMKNLVLKIMRGTYPPVSNSYSYDLRGLIAKLFKRTPKERPSVNSILRINFIQKRVNKFLSEDQINDEFSHTIMHGKRMAKVLPPQPANRPPSAAAGRKSPAVNRPAQARYNPANVYGAPIVRKSKENRASQEKRPGSARGSRPGSAASSRPGSAAGSRPGSARSSNDNNVEELRRKKIELMEKEKKRREEERKAALEQRHKQLLEKQKMARINKAREEGWNHLFGSNDAEQVKKEVKEERKPHPVDQINWPPPRNPPAVAHAPAPQPARDRGKYEHYHAYLDKLQQDKMARKAVDPRPVQQPPAAYMAAPRPGPDPSKAVPVWQRAPEMQQAGPIYGRNPAARERRIESQAAERDRIVNDFIQRKNAAAMNKARAQADLFGGGDPRFQAQPELRKREPEPEDPPLSAREKAEQEYLDKLKKIRQNNFVERKGILQNQGKDVKQNAEEVRRDKIAALRQQAEDRAKQLRLHLDEQRHAEIEKKKREWQMKVQQNHPAAPQPAMKPVPAVPMTAALKAVGVEPKVLPEAEAKPAIGVTLALQAIGAQPVEEPPPAEPAPRPKSSVQQQKDEILKKLNEKGPPRGKWGAGNVPLAQKEEENEPPESSRPKWGEGEGAGDLLKNVTLEQTASQMEATSAQDKVIHNPVSGKGDADDDLTSARRQWGRPGSTILNVLKQAPIREGTMASNGSESSESSPATTQDASRQKTHNATVTIEKTSIPIQKGTITIATSDQVPGVPFLKRPDISHQFENITEQSFSESNDRDKDNSAPSHVESNQGDITPPREEKDHVVKDSSKEELPAQKPPIPSKPPIPPPKPLLLPKPVLLSKPDKPMGFEKLHERPKSADMKQNEKLFSKVKLENSDNEEEQKSSKDVDSKDDNNLVVADAGEEEEKLKKDSRSKVLMGLTSGQFDIGNAQLLRTCSMPDLAKLFQTIDQLDLPYVSSQRRSYDSQIKNKDKQSLLSNVDLEEEDDGIPPLNLDDDDVEDGAEELDDEDYEDLVSVRETMASLLLRKASTDEEASKNTTGRLSLASNKEDDIQEETNDGGDDEDREEEDGEEENEDSFDGNSEADKLKEALEDMDNDGDDENFEDENNEEEEENEEDEDEGNEDDIDCSNQENNDDLFQSEKEKSYWGYHSTDTSDTDTQFGDDDADYDLFSRLEESRAQLESALGCDKFLKVYKTVQALQEDEDEKMSEGVDIVTKILGKEKEHLYPKIFQLVMADSAFQDDSGM